MIIGIGTDIFLMSRISKDVIHEEDAFIKKAYTQKEREEANHRENKHIFYATRFCAKEAIYKAISSIEIEFKPGDIEILTDDNGKPHAFIHGKTKEKLDQLTNGKYKIHVSISYDTEYASSFAIAEQYE